MYPVFKYLAPWAACLIITGCAANRPMPSRPETKPVAREKAAPSATRDRVRYPEEKPAGKKPSPPKEKAGPVASPTPPQSASALAAVALSDQGKSLLERKRVDEAIRVLERAVNLHPQNGENYYYLAEAWLIKGNAAQAAEFNHLAVIYLKNEANWQYRLRSQFTRIKALPEGN